MENFDIMAIKVDQRVQKATEMQSVLTKYGCNIKVRLGLHEAGDACSNQGLILLQTVGERAELEAFERELNAIRGVTAKAIAI